MRPLLIALLILLMPTATAIAADYTLGVDSLPQAGVPQGTVVKHTLHTSQVYPEITHDYWVYVPAQYNDAEPAAVMIFQDGRSYVSLEGPVRVPTVFDNLIHKKEMPVTIGIFVNPGSKERAYDQRDAQYVPLADTYARFLLEDVIPEVAKDYNLVTDASGRAVCGMSDGGLAAFTVGWERPDAFSKVISHIGSYTRLRGGSEYPYLIRKTRGSPKPIRVFLQDGANDINLIQGNWTLANLSMESALMFSRYDYRFEMGTGGHDLAHGGAIFPQTLRWLWRDYPGVTSAGVTASRDAVVGRWDVETNMLGRVSHGVLTIVAQGDGLTATLKDADEGEVEVKAIEFEDDVLRYEYVPPRSQDSWGKDSSGKDSKATLVTWVKVSGDTFAGALSSGTDSEIDFSITGRRTSWGP